MLKAAVIGPIAPVGATVKKCVECSATSADGQVCSGFGPGCLGLGRAASPPKCAEDLAVTLSAPKPPGESPT